MAVRDRNLVAWQAYVLVVTLVCLGLLGALGYIMFTSGTNAKQALEAQTRANAAEQNVRTATGKLDTLQIYLGAKQATAADLDALRTSLSADEEMNTIQKQFDADMGLFGAEVGAQDRSYKRLVEYLMQAVRQRNLSLDKMTKDVENLNKEVVTIRKEKDDAIAAAEAARAKLEQDLAQARDEFKKTLDEHQTKLEALKTAHQADFAKLEAARKTVEAKNAELLAENKKLTKFKKDMVKEQQDKIEREDFEASQAKIVDVDQGGTVLWIDIGRRQGLRSGLQFSIYNQDTVRISEATPKARIEVTDVQDEMAQAKVLHNQFSVPVLKGDLVFSPFWNAGGKKKQFAFLGKMDIDNNGSDDSDLLRTLIEQNGGIVVETVDAYGRNKKVKDPQTGTEGLSIYTHYLVKGADLRITAPNPDEDGGGIPDQTRNLASAYKDLEDRARELGITVINLDRLASLLKKLDEDRTIPLGAAMRSSDFNDRTTPRYSELTPEEKSQYNRTGPFGGMRSGPGGK
jgi:hypothetical protein